MMEEVGSHDGEDEHVRAAADAVRVDAVISDALQEAAQTNVPESKYDNNLPFVSKLVNQFIKCHKSEIESEALG